VSQKTVKFFEGRVTGNIWSPKVPYSFAITSLLLSCMLAILEPLTRKIRCQQGPLHGKRYATLQHRTLEDYRQTARQQGALQGDHVHQVCNHTSPQGLDFCKAAEDSTTPKDTYNTPLEKACSFVDN
jgi:hypothetical protein